MREIKPGNGRTISFVIVICFISALVLSTLAAALKKPQEEAVALFKSKQLLIAANILDFDGTIKATNKSASSRDILDLFHTHIHARLINPKGELITFEEANINEANYIRENEKYGYSTLPNKLIYVIQTNGQTTGYVIPINGYGLWDAIYGYLGLAANGNTVIGMTWYDQKETPGLGGDIALPEWERQFYGKQIFRESPDGSTNFERAPIGIEVVKGKVSEKLGNSPAAKSAVDGISGATITITGVNEAYSSCLEPYRPFLIKQAE